MNIKFKNMKYKYIPILSIFLLLPTFGMDDCNMLNSLEEDKLEISVRKRYRPAPQELDSDDNSPPLKMIKLLPVEDIDINLESDDESMDEFDGIISNLDPEDIKMLAEAEFKHAQYLHTKQYSNKKRAYDYYKLAAEHGHPEAQYVMGDKFQNGFLTKRSSNQAIKWYTLAANQGHIEAQYQLGLIFQHKMPYSYTTPIKWLTLAATNGHAGAQYSLGCKYQDIKGYEIALKWFTQAANQNHPNAQYCLGYMYQNGLGMTKDAGLALHWYTLAHKKGHKRAQKMINTVGTEDHMTTSPLDIVKLIFIRAESFNRDILCISKTFRDCFTPELRGALGPSLKTEVSLTEIGSFFHFISDWSKIQDAHLKIPFTFLKKNPNFEKLSQSLTNNTTLTSLTIMGSPINYSLGDLGAKKLAEGLRENKKLVSLDISYNQIGYRGLIDIADTLKHNTTLTELNLDLNDIDDKGASLLWGALSQNSTLKILSLRNNLIGKSEDYENDLARMLLKNTTLHTLNLLGNSYQHKTVISLAEALKINTTLTSLNLSENCISNTGQILLSRSQEVSETLHTLILKGDFDEDYNDYNNMLWELLD